MEDDSLQRKKLHLMQLNVQRTRLTDFGFFWIFGLAIAQMSKVRAPGSSQKKKNKVVQRGTFGTRFCRFTFNLLSLFFFWFLVLMWVKYKLYLLAKNRRFRREKIKSKVRVLYRFNLSKNHRERRRKKRLGRSVFLAIRTHSDVPR